MFSNNLYNVSFIIDIFNYFQNKKNHTNHLDNFPALTIPFIR